MTLNVGLGNVAPAIPPKTGSRGDKDQKGAERGFNDALAAGSGKAKARQDGDGSETRPTRAALELVNGLDALAEKQTMSPVMEEPEPGENFDAILEGVLLESSRPNVETAANALAEAAVFGTGAAADTGNLPLTEQAADEADVSQGPPAVSTGPQSASPAVVQADGATRTAPAATMAAPAPRQGGDLPERQRATISGQKQQGTAGFGPSYAARPAEGRTDPAATMQVTPASASNAAGEGAGRAGSDKSSGDGSQRLTNLPGADSLSGRVNVLGFNPGLISPAVTSPLSGQTAAGLVSAMENDLTWRAAAAKDGPQELQRGHSLSSGVNSLRIQLHPIELGMVTARLKASGEQLSVEIQVETNDARQKLATDSESILKALRAVGYDIDKVTVTQNASNPSGQGQQQSSGRDSFAANQQTQGDGDARGRDGGRGAGTQHNDGARHGTGETAAERAGGSLYI